MKKLIGLLFGGVVLLAGCASERVMEIDAENPVFSISQLGVKFDNRFIEPDEVIDILEDASVPKSQTIYIHVDSNALDMRVPSRLMAILAKAGYTRPILITKRHAESYKIERRTR